MQHGSAWRWAGFGLILLALVLAWRWSPLAEWVAPERLLRTLEGLRALGYGPLLVMVLFVVGGLLIVPITALILATILAYGPLTGLAYALLGMLANAVVGYGVGARLGRRGLRRLAGERLNRVSSRLGERGILTVFLLRIVPVAPFSVINLVAGASHVTFRDYLLGTVLGMAPGMLAIALLIDRVLALLAEPGPRTLGTLFAVVFVLATAAILISHWARRRRERRS